MAMTNAERQKRWRETNPVLYARQLHKREIKKAALAFISFPDEVNAMIQQLNTAINTAKEV